MVQEIHRCHPPIKNLPFGGEHSITPGHVYPNVYPTGKTREAKIEKIMSRRLVTCNPHFTVLDVVKLMKNKHLRRIPVVESHKKLVGLVTDFDLALFGWDFE